MQPTITKTDGIFGATDLSNIQWTDYTSSQTLQANQLLTVTGGDGVPDGYAINRGMGVPQYYDSKTDTWLGDTSGLVSVYDSLNYNVIFIRNTAGESGGTFYVCKDEDIVKIPDITSNSVFRVRINGSVDHVNFNQFKRLKPLHSADEIIPVLPFNLSTAGNGDKLFGYVAIKNLANISKVGIGIIQVRSGTLVNENGLAFPQGKQYLTNASDQPIQDLETRVSILETKVSQLEAKVAEHDKVIKDLPAIVAAVSSNVSKLYIAR